MNQIKHNLIRSRKIRQSILKQAFEGKLLREASKDYMQQSDKQTTLTNYF